MSRKILRLLWRAAKAVALFAIDAIGWIAIAIIGASRGPGKGRTGQETSLAYVSAKVGAGRRAAVETPRANPPAPEIHSLPHAGLTGRVGGPTCALPARCPRCGDLLEEFASHFLCNGCDSAWHMAPEGNLVQGRAA